MAVTVTRPNGSRSDDRSSTVVSSSEYIFAFEPRPARTAAVMSARPSSLHSGHVPFLFEYTAAQRAPAFAKVFRFHGASPQPNVGHLARMKNILARVSEHPGLYAGGNGYVGTGIPDAIKQGEDIAARIAPLK